jgi:hypothetical protein
MKYRTKEELSRDIARAADAYGFRIGDPKLYFGFPQISSEEVNFTYATNISDESDWQTGRIVTELRVIASVRKMGGAPTPEELMKTAAEIKRAAELTCGMQMLKYEEQYR